MLLRGRLGELTDDVEGARAAYAAVIQRALTLEDGASLAARGAQGLARLAFGDARTTWLARAVGFAEVSGEPERFAELTIELARHLDERGQRVQALTVLVQGRESVQDPAALQAITAAGDALADRWGQRTFREVLRQVEAATAE